MSCCRRLTSDVHQVHLILVVVVGGEGKSAPSQVTTSFESVSTDKANLLYLKTETETETETEMSALKLRAL